MFINAMLGNNTQGKMDLDEPVLLPENELLIQFSSNIYTFEKLLFSARNGDKEIKAKLAKPFKVDVSKLLFPGHIELEISAISKGEPVKTWRLQDIVIKDVKHTYMAIPELVELHNEIGTVKGALKELHNILVKNNLA